MRCEGKQGTVGSKIQAQPVRLLSSCPLTTTQTLPHYIVEEYSAITTSPTPTNSILKKPFSQCFWVSFVLFCLSRLLSSTCASAYPLTGSCPVSSYVLTHTCLYSSLSSAVCPLLDLLYRQHHSLLKLVPRSAVSFHRLSPFLCFRARFSLFSQRCSPSHLRHYLS